MVKLGIYALCKDQEDQVDGFVEQMEHVDHVLVVDLGSKDDSVLRLRNRGVRVIELKMESDRADLNRTAALEAMSESMDVCMCLEMYQRLDHGWALMIKNSWVQGCTRMTYWINEGKHRYLGDWIHARHGYAWRYPIHEELIPTSPENEHHVEVDLRQEQQPVKLNLPLLKKGIEENMNIGYLRMKMAHDCLYAACGSSEDLSPHFEGRLAVERALHCEDLNPGERAYTCFIGSLLYPIADRESWLMRAVIEEADCREWWYHLADYLSANGHSQRALVAIDHAARLDDLPHKKHNSLDAWGPELYILAAKCAVDCDRRDLADRYYTRGTRLFKDSVELARLYGEFLS